MDCHDAIPDIFFEWIEKQKMFWIASTALNGDLDLSSKGCIESVRVLNKNRVLWHKDVTDSETIAHIREPGNGKITIMFHDAPWVLKMWGTATVHEFGTPEYVKLIEPRETLRLASRAVIVIDVHKVTTSHDFSFLDARTNPFSDRLSWLQTFRSAVWGNKSIFKKESTSSGMPTVEYLDFAKHLQAVQSFCYGFCEDKLVVFEEYRTAMNTFKRGDAAYKNGACIIGKPGIGKTNFIVYAVVELLREEQPVAVQVLWSLKPEYLLFTSNSVSLCNEQQTLNPLDLYPLIWAFSDSNDAPSGPTLAFFTTSRAQVRVFQTTSPVQEHWKEWTTKHGVNLYTMDVPSMKELKDLAIILGHDAEHMKGLANKWGHVLWVLLRLLEAPSRELALEREVVLTTMRATRHPRSTFTAIANYDSSRTPLDPSLVFFVKPESETHRDVPSIYVPTRWLTWNIVDELFRLPEESERVDFFDIMSTQAQTRSILGWMFEAVAFRFLAHEKDLTIRWCDGNTETLSLPFPRTRIGDSGLKNAKPPFSWCSPSSKYPGINAAIVTADGVLGAQATIGFKHRPPTKGFKKLQNKISREWSQWKVLLVGFRDDQAELFLREYANGMRVTDEIHLPVGWVTVPLGRYGFSFLERALSQAMEADTGDIGVAEDDEEESVDTRA